MTNPPDLTRPATGNFRDLWDLEGKVFIVLGAGGGGIGMATSRALADLGASLVLVDQARELAVQVAEEVGGIAVAVDATQEHGVVAAIDAAVDAFGHIDGGVDIIGRGARSSIDEMTPDVWDALFDVNLRHAYLLGHLLGPRLAEAGSGSLTFIASQSAFRGNHVTPAYAAAKAALISWVMSLSNTYAPYGVRANAVSPDFTVTPRFVEVMGDRAAEITRQIPLKQANLPADIAAAVAFLVSPAARTITGTNLLVDGGALARHPLYGDRLDATHVD